MVYEPDIVGPITEMSHDGITDTYTVTVNGETFDIGPGVRSLEGSPGRSNSLLMYGTEGDTAWYASIALSSSGASGPCGTLRTTSAWDAGDSIVFAFTGWGADTSDVGILLPRAATFEAPIHLEDDGRYPLPYTQWCISTRGEVETVSKL